MTGYAERTVTIRGLELDYPEKVRPGYHYPDWSSPRDPETDYPTGRLYQEAKVYFEAGTAFVPVSLLDELTEVDNSWGCGGAFLINDPRVKWALESAGLIHVETKGGVYTDAAQRIRIQEKIDFIRRCSS